MAEVWLARRAVMPGGLKPCALKIIHGRIAAKPRNRRMFLQEARLALKLRHANVVSVFDVGEAQGRLFMALEWVDGVDLRCFVRQVCAGLGPLDVPVVCHIVFELLQGLRHAHGLCVGGQPLGVIHRDVAPHNVLVSAAGEVKLADFGIARVAGELSSGMHVKGRARYMAPEQLQGEATQASDLFALGALLHELLAGRRFREELRHRSDWHRVIANAPIPPLERPGVPPALEALRMGLLHADPRRRIASAEDALHQLLRCPPWSPAADRLRAMYARCVGAPRRTGLTYSESRPVALQPSWPKRVVAVDPKPAAEHAVVPPFVPPPVIATASRRTASAQPGGSSSSSPTPVLFRKHDEAAVAAASVDLWALASPSCSASPRPLPSPSPSWTPSASASRATMPGRAGSARMGLGRWIHGELAPPSRGGLARSARGGIRRRCSLPLRRPRSSRYLRAMGWVGRGLWVLAAVLAVVAVGLALAPVGAGPSACIREPFVPVERQAWVRLRGDDRPLAQVRIDMQVLGVGSNAQCWVSPGIHELAWRPSPEDPWRSFGPQTLISAKEHLLRVGGDGLAISAYDP